MTTHLDGGLLLLSVPDAAKRLGISRRTLDRHIARGELAIVRVGSRVLVAEADILAFVAARREQSR
jgi:excisionase family DNA binding protein